MPLKQAQQAEKPQAQTATDREQNLYTVFVSQGIKQLAQQDYQNLPKNTQDIASALFVIVDRVVTSGEKNGVVFSFPVILHGANEILNTLLSIAGIELSNKETAEVAGLAVGKYLQNAVDTGRMTEKEVVELGKQAKQQYQQAAKTAQVKQPAQQQGINTQKQQAAPLLKREG